MGRQHKVVQGECLSSIARNYGYRNYQGIYNHPDNLALRSKRPNPNLIYPGDILIIPDKELKTVERPTDQRHVFVARGSKTFLAIEVLVDGQPVPNAQYELTVGRQIYRGSTTADGLIKQEIEPLEMRGTLKIVDPLLEWDLQIGALDPVEEVTGVQQRLNNLGYVCGPEDGVAGPRTRGALRQFQSQHQLRLNGNIDAATQSMLKNAHDGR
jgi:hypothetical protein